MHETTQQVWSLTSERCLICIQQHSFLWQQASKTLLGVLAPDPGTLCTQMIAGDGPAVRMHGSAGLCPCRAGVS